MGAKHSLRQLVGDDAGATTYGVHQMGLYQAVGVLQPASLPGSVLHSCGAVARYMFGRVLFKACASTLM